MKAEDEPVIREDRRGRAQPRLVLRLNASVAGTRRTKYATGGRAGR